MAHELAHTMQGGHGVRRARAKDCAKKPQCPKEDGIGTASGKFSITIYADKEGPFLLIPITSGVGHSWIRLEDDKGKYWTYGFWPKCGFDASNPKADVEGCVHHPDTSHKATASQKIDLTASEFAAAYKYAKTVCENQPKYNLFALQCTEYVKRTLAAAGKGSYGGFGLIWESPNALDTYMRANALVLGMSVTGASSATNNSGAGSVGFHMAYRHQFYSLLGTKLRLYGVAKTELSAPVKSLDAGVGLELNPQKVWLPSLYLEGRGTFGDLNPTPNRTQIGAGVSGSLGARYNIDELAVIGVEYNLVKDLVAQDPVLHRLMLTIGIRLF